jgi:hypothetical protein
MIPILFCVLLFALLLVAVGLLVKSQRRAAARLVENTALQSRLFASGVAAGVACGRVRLLTNALGSFGGLLACPVAAGRLSASEAELLCLLGQAAEQLPPPSVDRPGYLPSLGDSLAVLGEIQRAVVKTGNPVLADLWARGSYGDYFAMIRCLFLQHGADPSATRHLSA